MLGDTLVVDAVVHGYNWAPSNFAIPVAESTSAAGWGLHQLMTREPRYLLTEDEFIRDWPAEDVSDTLFYESDTDVICHHGTPIFDFYKDGHSDTNKGYTIRDQYPERTLVYGAVNPFVPGDEWRQHLEDYKAKGVNGLKVYAARYDGGHTIEQRLDDPELGYPFIERALELGFNVIATHKAIPFGPVRSEPYGVSDIPDVLAVFPQMNFEIVHSGWAFLEDTTFLAFFQNCWFNLETCFPLILRQPRRFAEFMAALIGSGGGDRIIYASGMAIGHPQPALEAFRDFQLPGDLLDGYGVPQISDELKAGILGQNFLRLHGIDEGGLRSRIADDEVARRKADGLAEPWSHMRSRSPVAS